ncbi:hypothetical protein [Paramagnetospirillum marisnigri]|uniref:hypothetical protein n=1 Tax=Paramagnetospirillum marisnigri TaxID=1285242 RepID=UPI0012E896CC|nr:hypothetical protein [Paramagnetospirillum marisnigri]
MSNNSRFIVDIDNCNSNNERVVIEIISELTSEATVYDDIEVDFNRCIDYKNIITAIRKNNFDEAFSYLKDGYTYFVELWLYNASFATRGTSIIMLDVEYHNESEIVECLINDSGWSGKAHKEMIKSVWKEFLKGHQSYV